MRDGLDDALARLSRWEEVRRRSHERDRAGVPPEESPPVYPEPPAPAPAPAAPPLSPPQSSALSFSTPPLSTSPLSAPSMPEPPVSAPPVSAPPVSAMEEATAAVRDVVARHPRLAVTMIMNDGDVTSSVQLAWWGGEVRVSTMRLDDAPETVEETGPVYHVPVDTTYDPQTAALWGPGPSAGAAPPDIEEPPLPMPVPAEPVDAAAVDTAAARLAAMLRRDPMLLANPPED